MYAVQVFRHIRARGTSVFLAFALCSGCGSSKKSMRLEDTEGRVFQWTCDQRKTCTISSSVQAQPSTPQPPGARSAFEVRQASRLYVVCDAWKIGNEAPVSAPFDCRALVCSSDAQCPPATGMKTGACASRLCIDPAGPITSFDAVALCLAGSGAPSGTPSQVERFALGNNCGNPCRVPSVCRQL